MTSVTTTQLSEAPPTSELHAPSIFQRASDFGSACARPVTNETLSALEGYEGVYWTRSAGCRIPIDDKKIGTWVIRDGDGGEGELS